MPITNTEVVTQFAQAGTVDTQLLDQSCRTLAQRYSYLFNSFGPWTEAVYKAQPSYPGLSQVQIAQRWVWLDDQAKLAVSLSTNHDLLVDELH